MANSSVLIVGAGPTGLNLALRLHRMGAAFRIIDQHDGPAQESRALAVHARTLEFYAQLRLADAIVAGGTVIEAIRVLHDGKQRVRIPIGDIGEGLSPFPFILGFPQDEHERFLADHLRGAGVEVERGTSLASFTQDDEGVEATIRGADGREERARSAYLCGCDGARSTVRQGLGTGFGGGTYQHLYYVADVRLRQRDTGRDFTLATGADTFALRLPARKGEMERLIGFAPDGIEHPRFEDVRAAAERLLDVEVAEVNWFSTYRVHHRVADQFRCGRAFLLGDAGHLHSPAGGQGMNTGIGDAVNLAWKLAQVLDGRAPPALLDTYETERLPFARELVATTDRVFRAAVAGGFAGELMRSAVMPLVVPAVTHFGAGRRALFRFASQIHIRYPHGALSEGKAGQVAGGDRLPWVRAAGNFAPLGSLAWQVHVYGEVPAGFAAEVAPLALPVHGFAWDGDAEAAGLARGAAYLVRPDGHVALAMAVPDAGAVRDYAVRHGLRFARG